MILSLAMLVLAGGAPAEAPLDDIQRSHVDANVPSAEDFDRFLQRDLDKYFSARLGKSSHTEYEMLRDGPTQSGIAYPKFYVWIRASSNGKVADEGAVRVAAIERKEFRVTHFVSAADARADPDALSKVFPAPVCERIKSKLRKRD